MGYATFKQYIKLIFIVLIICIIGVGVSIGVSIQVIPTHEKFENEYLELQGYFQSVVDYAKDKDWEYFYTLQGNVTKLDVREKKFAQTEIIKIDQDRVIQALGFLYNNKYTDIYKESNAVWFNKDMFFRGGIGIVYSLDGTEPDNGLVGTLEPFDQYGWYFYMEK